MPSAATQSPGTGGSANKGGGAARPSIPFIRASARHVEAPFFDQIYTMNANLQDFGVIEVPAYGYVRSILLYVNGTASGNSAAVTFNEDAPFTALQNIQFSEPNGAQILAVNDGYELYLINKWSGYQGPGNSNDHRGDPTYSQVPSTGGSGGSFSFVLRIPVELDLRSGLGALPNQAANATFRVRAALAPLSTVFGTSPTAASLSVRVRMIAETWDQPEVSSGGAANQTTPPAMNTTQFWSRQVYNLGAGGSQTIRLTRVGNYLRNQIFILRSGSASTQGAGQRYNADTLWTTPAATVGGSAAAVSDGQVIFYIDSRPVQVINDRIWQQYMWERSGGYGGFYAYGPAAYGGVQGNPSAQTIVTTAQNAKDTPFGLDNGVRVLDWMTEFDGNYGRENRDLWQPTLGSTRFELQSSFGTLTNGTLTVLTNDVAIAGNVFMG